MEGLNNGKSISRGKLPGLAPAGVASSAACPAIRERGGGRKAATVIGAAGVAQYVTRSNCPAAAMSFLETTVRFREDGKSVRVSQP